MLSLLRDALRLDPLEMYPNAAYEPMRANCELMVRKNRLRDTPWFPRTVRAIAFLRTCVSAILGSKKFPVANPGSHVLVGLTKNQVTALQPVEESLANDFSCATTFVRSSDFAGLSNTATLAALPFFPMLVWRMLTSRGYRFRSFRWALDDYWRSYGIYVAIRHWLRRNAVRSITVSNDHLLLPCLIVQAAQDENVPTFYLQHACVPAWFPPLRVDHALLDGEDAFRKYEVADPSRTRCYLIGIPKFDKYIHCINQNPRVDAIGICFSLADEEDRCVELLQSITRFADRKLIARPHMGMSDAIKDRLRGICDAEGIEFSQHGEESAFDFLSRIDLLISGTSAIALEAALINVTALNYVLCRDTPDWYGFIENGLTRSTDSIEELLGWIEAQLDRRDDVRTLAKRYAASVETASDGRSAEIAADLIATLGRSRKRMREVGPGLVAVE